MDETTRQWVEARIKKTEESFNSVSAEIRKIDAAEEGLAKKKSELNVELFRLQGENRLLKDMLEQK